MARSLNFDLTLISVAKTRNENGYAIDGAETERTVFCDAESVKRSEFYDALRAGFETTAVFVLWLADYNGEKKCRFDEREYRVIRTYRDGDYIELTCVDAGEDNGENDV